MFIISIVKSIKDRCLKVEIVNSYFRGSHYLIEAKFGNQNLFFESDKLLENGEEVCLKIK